MTGLCFALQVLRSVGGGRLESTEAEAEAGQPDQTMKSSTESMELRCVILFYLYTVVFRRLADVLQIFGETSGKCTPT